MYKKGDLIIVRGRALSRDDNAFFIGVVVADEINRRFTKQYDDMWGTQELIWEKVYKVLVRGKIEDIHYYHIKGKLNEKI